MWPLRPVVWRFPPIFNLQSGLPLRPDASSRLPFHFIVFKFMCVFSFIIDPGRVCGCWQELLSFATALSLSLYHCRPGPPRPPRDFSHYLCMTVIIFFEFDYEGPGAHASADLVVLPPSEVPTSPVSCFGHFPPHADLTLLTAYFSIDLEMVRSEARGDFILGWRPEKSLALPLERLPAPQPAAVNFSKVRLFTHLVPVQPPQSLIL